MRKSVDSWRSWLGLYLKALLHKLWSLDQQPGACFEMQNLRTHPRPRKQNLHFNKTLKGVMCILKFEKHSRKARHLGLSPDCNLMGLGWGQGTHILKKAFQVIWRALGSEPLLCPSLETLWNGKMEQGKAWRIPALPLISYVTSGMSLEKERLDQ